jgi:hypothetical protein
MPRTIRLIREWHAHLGGPTLWDRLKLGLGLARAAPCDSYASVWIACTPEEGGQDHEQRGMKLTGPVPEEAAAAFVSRLRDLVEAAGIEVVREVYADD